jgi:hypothetical protein
MPSRVVSCGLPSVTKLSSVLALRLQPRRLPLSDSLLVGSGEMGGGRVTAVGGSVCGISNCLAIFAPLPPHTT